MKKKSELKYTPLLFLVLAVLGCAKDRTLEDYKKENAERQAAQYQPATGVYTGVLTSAKGKELGAIEMNFHTVMDPQSSTDGSAATSAPRLACDIIYKDGISAPINLGSDKANYNPDSHLFTGTIQLFGSTATTTGAGTSATAPAAKPSLAIETYLADGRASHGIIKLNNAASYAVHFELVRNSDPIDAVLSKVMAKVTTQSIDAAEQFSYLGKTQFFNKQTRPVHIVIRQPHQNNEADFLDLLSPSKSVVVNFNYGPTVQLVYDAQIDSEANTLVGKTILGQSTNNPASGFRIDVKCSFKNLRKSIDCDQTPANGVPAKSTASLDLNNSPDPVDPTDGLATERRTFHGSGQVGSAINRIDLQLLFPARSAVDDFADLIGVSAPEKILSAAVGFGFELNEPFYISFPTAKWDLRNHTLTASNVLIMNGGEQSLASIECSHFDLYKAVNTTSCEYSSKDKRIHISFKTQNGN